MILPKKGTKSKLRLDYQLIEQWISAGAKVLDLGCGDGQLLEDLIRNKGVDGRGIDVSDEEVMKCIGRGVPVYHGDMIEGMSFYNDGHFDTVILSQTLQQTLDPRAVLREMLRVGKSAIVSFPNFAHWRVRLQLLLSGRMPRTRNLPHHWYNTPNVHLLTIRDWRDLCRREGYRIVQEIFLTANYVKIIPVIENWRAGIGIFQIEKP